MLVTCFPVVLFRLRPVKSVFSPVETVSICVRVSCVLGARRARILGRDERRATSQSFLGVEMNDHAMARKNKSKK